MVRVGIIDEQIGRIDRIVESLDRLSGRAPRRPELRLVPASTEPATWTEILDEWGRRVDHLEGEPGRPMLRLVGKED